MDALSRRKFFFASSGAAAGSLLVPGLLGAADDDHHHDFAHSGLATGTLKPLKLNEIPGFLSAQQIAPHHLAHYGEALKAFVSIDYQNRKADYVEKFMQHIDWPEANRRFRAAS